MARYFLPSHVYFCFRGESIVFLDLSRDNYILVTGDAAIALRAVTVNPHADGHGSKAISALRGLLDAGLLTTDPNLGRCLTPTETSLAMDQLDDPDVLLDVEVTAGHVWRFIQACISSAVRQRWSSLEDIVSAVEHRKARHAFLTPLDIAKARDLTTLFQRLRCFFPVNYLCLYDSLALIEFLARYNIFPTWVFGIKLEPWAAHCWVQEAGFTFNEGVEEATKYTPIMTI